MSRKRFVSLLLSLSSPLITDQLPVSGLLPDRVPPVQTTAAVCAGYGPGGHAAASGLVRHCLWSLICSHVFIWKKI